MEDEHFVQLRGGTVRDQPVSLLGILDGHCGRRVATLGKKHLPHFFFRHSALGDNNALALVEAILQTDREIFHRLHGTTSGGGPRKSRKNRKGRSEAAKKKKGKNKTHLLVANGNFNTSRRLPYSAYGADDDDDDDEDNSDDSEDDSGFDEFFGGGGGGGGLVGGGSTLITAAVHGRMLYVACLGDARAVLYDGQSAIAMSEDHKPQNPKENARIVRCGGFVQFGRVCGVLAVSRALGDYEFKFSADNNNNNNNSSSNNYDAPLPSPGSPSTASRFRSNRELMVSNVADVKQLSLTDDSMFLVLACDGLWDVLSNDEVTQFVKDFLTYTPDINDPAAAAGTKEKPGPAVVQRALDCCSQKLAEFAVDRGSTDNVSVMVLFFHDVVDCVVRFSSPHAGRRSGGQNKSIASAGSNAATTTVSSRHLRVVNGGAFGASTVKKKKKKKKTL